MRKPGVLDYLLGSPFVVLPVGVGFLASLWLGIGGDNAFGLLAVILVPVGIVATRAADRVRRYETWRRDWDALGGDQR